jgi:hypothetical protein
MSALRWVGYGALVLLLAAVIALVSQGMRPIVDRGSHSTLSTDPGGTSALFRLVEECGYTATRSEEAYEGVSDGPSVFVVMPPAETSAPARDMESDRPDGTDLATRLTRMAERGRSVVVFGPTSLGSHELEKLGLERRDDTAPPEPASPSFAGLPPLAEPGWQRLVAKERAWMPLMANDNSAFLLARPMGKGWLFVCASAEAFQNDTIAEGGHAELAMRLISLAARGSKHVAFDEYIHGYGDESMWARIGLPGRAAAWQLLAAFAAVVYSIGHRFGYPVARRTPPPALGEYVTAIAHLYERAGAPGLALRTIRRQAIRRSAALAGVPPGLDEAQWLAGLPAGLRGVLEEMDRTATTDISPEVAAHQCRNLDREIEAYATSRHAERG